MSFSTHNQFQLGLPNKQPSFLSISRVSALVGTDGDDLDDRVAATGSSQPPTFTGESLRGLFKNTLPATNLATIGGVGVSRNPTVQNASERRISIGFFDFFNRTGIRPTTNTDINDSIQLSGGGLLFDDSTINPVLSQPGALDDTFAVVNVDPATGNPTEFSFTGTQDSALPNNGAYLYTTPCWLAPQTQPLPSQVTVGQSPPDSQCNDGTDYPESLADNALVSPVQNEIFYNSEATGLVKGGPLETFSNFGLNQGKVLKGGNAVAVVQLTGPLAFPASFEGEVLDNASVGVFGNDADKPVYLTAQDIISDDDSFADGNGNQIFTNTIPPLNPNTLGIALEYRLVDIPGGDTKNPGDSVAVQWKVTFNVSGQNTGTRFGVGTQIMIPVAGFGATGNGNPILNLFGGAPTATKFENAFPPGASPAVTTYNNVRITENLIITLTEDDLIGGSPFTDLNPKTLKTKNQSVLQPKIINAAGTRVFTQIMSTSANAAFDLPGGLEPQLVLPGPGGFIVN